MSDDGRRSSSAEPVERTPRDQQASGPPSAEECLPRGPPPPLPASHRHVPRCQPVDPDLPSEGDDDRTGSDDSRPEQRWPMLAGRRLHGPHLPSGRFADSSSRSRSRSRSGAASSSSDTLSSEEASGRSPGPVVPPPPAAHPAEDDAGEDARDAADDDAESGSWSDTSLDLAGPALEQAIGTLLGMYRLQLGRADLLTNRELGGKVGGLRRHLRHKPWTYISSHARRLLDGEDLARWQAFEYRATHEFRPHRRDAAATD